VTGAGLEPRELGATGLRVTPLCFGGGPLGSMPETFHEETSQEEAYATVREIFAGPVNFLDTAASYGDGESERRIGHVLAEIGGIPAGVVLATKVDRDLDTGEFTGAQVRRSLERSLTLLGVDRLPLVYLHDPEHIGFAEGMADGGPALTLAALRDEGLVDHIGVAGGPVNLMRSYLETGLFEVLITHNRMTLLDRGADDLIGFAHDRGVGVVNAAVFGGGILVRGQHAVPRYAYRAAPKSVLDVVERMWWLCADFGVPLGAAALQFSLRDPRITSSIVGASHVEHVREAIAFAGWPIPEELWDQLAPLSAPVETWLDRAREQPRSDVG
jgi:D-threo-aldose 1-dehydrogenase